VRALRARLQAVLAGFQRWYAGHSRRDQRIILGILIFGAICLVYLYGVVPLRDYRQRVSDEVVEGQEQLARSARVLGSADSLRAERAELEKRLKQTRGHLLPGRGGTLGAAALQERTNSLAAEKGITVQSTQVMKEEAVDPYRKVSVRLTLSGELKPFAELLSGLEYDQQLAIPFVEANRRGAVPGAKGPRTIQATVEVTGFVLGEEAKGEEGPAAEGAEAVEAAAEGSATTTTTPEQAGPAPTAPTGATGPSGTAAPPPGSAPAPTGPSGSATTSAPPPGATTTTAAVPPRAAPTTTVAGATPTTIAGATTTTRPAGGLMAPLGLKRGKPQHQGGE
jgi:Type II secretion system (T2SS), protein M subtype b